MKNKVTHIISYSLLFLYISIKIAGLHAFVHEDDKEDFASCDVCEHVITQNFTPFVADAVISFLPNLPVFYTTHKVNPIKNILKDTSLKTYSLFSRPPPFSV